MVSRSTVGNELTERDGLIRQDLGHLFEIVRHKLATFFVREKAQGRLVKDADEEHLAAFCIATKAIGEDHWNALQQELARVSLTAHRIELGRGQRSSDQVTRAGRGNSR